MNRIKVMFAMGGSMKRAGAETMIMQYLRQFVKDELFEFSVLVHGYDRGDYDDEITAYNVPIYRVPVRGQHPLTYTHEVEKVLKEHSVDIIHCNMDSACGDFLEIARKCGIKIRIAHSHSTRFQAQRGIKKIIAKNSKQKIHTVATHRLACSDKAGKWLFGCDSYKIINNAIDLNCYLPNDKVRQEMRKELGINKETIVIGHIGRFCYEKNHKLLLQIFAEFKNKSINSKLILVGTGNLMDEMKSYAVELGVSNDVMFLGLSSEIPKLLQAMDAFVMPSLFEGLPVSGIEAQAAGLPCLFADTITSEICMTSYAKRIPLDDIDKWVEALEQVPLIKNAEEAQVQLCAKGYDIVQEAEKLKSYYINIYRKAQKQC